MQFEYKCPVCGFVNSRNGNFARIVCSICGAEFEVTGTPVIIPSVWTGTHTMPEYEITTTSTDTVTWVDWIPVTC